MRMVYTPALLTFLSLVFASSIGVAGAANSDVSKTKANPMQLAKDSLTLTRSQEKTVWNDIRKQASEQTAHLRFAASIGVEVPKNVTLRRIPAHAVNQIPALKPYDYALIRDRLLIVNPSDKKVVDVIRRNA